MCACASGRDGATHESRVIESPSREAVGACLAPDSGRSISIGSGGQQLVCPGGGRRRSLAALAPAIMKLTLEAWPADRPADRPICRREESRERPPRRVNERASHRAQQLVCFSLGQPAGHYNDERTSGRMIVMIITAGSYDEIDNRLLMIIIKHNNHPQLSSGARADSQLFNTQLSHLISCNYQLLLGFSSRGEGRFLLPAWSSECACACVWRHWRLMEPERPSSPVARLAPHLKPSCARVWPPANSSNNRTWTRMGMQMSGAGKQRVYEPTECSDGAQLVVAFVCSVGRNESSN